MEERERIIQSLDEASRALQTADHMTYVTFPIVKEKRLLLKVLSEIARSILKIINAILQFEYYNKKIQLYKDAKENFRTFLSISPNYQITKEQIDKIIDIIKINEKHQKSPFEFVKNENIIIMTDNMQPVTLNLDKIKIYLLETKDLLRKANLAIKKP